MPVKRNNTSFSLYIYKVLKQVHPDTGISKKAMAVVDSFVHDMFIRITEESRELVLMHEKTTITSREIQTATRLVLGGELAKHGVSEGVKAVTKFRYSGDDGCDDAPVRRRNTSQSARAGLQFPVGRVKRMLKERTKNRIGATAPVYLAAVLEYLVAEVLELGGNACKDLRLKRITPRHVTLAIRGDEELDRLIPAAIPGGGVIPHIHKSLISKPNSKCDNDIEQY